MKLHACAGALALGMAALALAPANAQSYPQRSVRVVVPLAAGGGMDTVTRALSQKLSDSFGQSFVVDNRPGAGSQVALDILSGAAPDGHTLMMISATTVIHPLLYKSRFDILRDFAPVSQVTEQGYTLVVHPKLPARNVGEFVSYLKSHPHRVNYASSGIGSPIHMTGELFQHATGTQMTHIPFKGMGAAYNDLIGGRVESAFATVISSLPHVKAGRLRALAVTAPERVKPMPEVPTLREAGVKVAVVNWYGLVAPKATPLPVVQKISQEVTKAMQSPEVVRRLAGDGSEAVGTTPQAFASHLREERDQWAAVIRRAGIKGE